MFLACLRFYCHWMPGSEILEVCVNPSVSPVTSPGFLKNSVLFSMTLIILLRLPNASHTSSMNLLEHSVYSTGPVPGPMLVRSTACQPNSETNVLSLWMPLWSPGM